MGGRRIVDHLDFDEDESLFTSQSRGDESISPLFALFHLDGERGIGDVPAADRHLRPFWGMVLVQNGLAGRFMLGHCLLLNDLAVHRLHALRLHFHLEQIQKVGRCLAADSAQGQMEGVAEPQKWRQSRCQRRIGSEQKLKILGWRRECSSKAR